MRYHNYHTGSDCEQKMFSILLTIFFLTVSIIRATKPMLLLLRKKQQQNNCLIYIPWA